MKKVAGCLVLIAASCMTVPAPELPPAKAEPPKPLTAAELGQQIDATRYASCRLGEERLGQIEAQLRALAEQAPENSPARKEAQAVTAKLKPAREAIAQRRADLGSCVIRIGGRPLDPATHAIVVPDQPTPQEDHAANDLNAHIERLTGRDLPMVTDSALAQQVPVVVGNCPRTLRKLGVRIDTKGLGLEGIVIRTKGPALVLAGNQRGILYAVYTFLEDYCGCRWFTPECTVIPKTGAFDIADLNVHHIPPLEYRSTDYPCSRPADFAVRNKLNGTQTQIDERRGGKIDYGTFVHTFNSILDPAKHFAEHPEYFSEIKGKRQGGNTQLCLTNPEVLAIAKKTVRDWMKYAPKATIFSVSQNDWYNFCECAQCKALDDAEGTHAATMIAFVNAIARDVAEDYPGKLVDTLAYQYTRTPPKTLRVEPNVCVRLCTIECDFAHPLDQSTHPQNQKFVKDIQGWNKLCNRLYIWDYIIDYGHSVMPWPNLYALIPNIRFFIANGVKGLYEEACYFTKGSELAELRTWIIAKAMWNPSYDTDRAIDEFLAGYYGAAAKPIRAYINLMHEPVLKDPNMYIHIWTGPNAPYLNDKAIAEASRLFDEAEKAVAADPVLLHRVQVARLPVLYVQIVNSTQGFKEEGDTLVDTATNDEGELLKRFESIARKEGLTMIREHQQYGNLDKWLASVSFAGKKLPIVRLANDSLELAILPSLGGRIWKMVHKPTGRDILKRYKDREGNELPDAGGYEEYSEGQYRSAGWNESYRVVKRDKQSVVLEAKLKSGLVLTRTITLDDKEPKATIESTLTNAGKEPRQACLRAHPSFAVSDLSRAALWVPVPGKPALQRPLALPADTPEKDEWLAPAELPAGEWRIADPAASYQIVCRFDPAQVGQCLLNRSARDHRVNLELSTQPATLAPGQSLSLKHTIEARPSADIRPPGP
ncbi:MAG TPA: DUF4838 domain-containing protein [Planctomycetota bacterium]|nr:DUF4838 domain-containing protein [Planctomycetota bacterium]HRR79764.1 DUF4838 domain-containing protein [Planctomycetota bacterium]HRT96833.1 DUF4838 domain-containing protein [Planctomycetota bacterium]